MKSKDVYHICRLIESVDTDALFYTGRKEITVISKDHIGLLHLVSDKPIFDCEERLVSPHDLIRGCDMSSKEYVLAKDGLSHTVDGITYYHPDLKGEPEELSWMDKIISSRDKCIYQTELLLKQLRVIIKCEPVSCSDNAFMVFAMDGRLGVGIKDGCHMFCGVTDKTDEVLFYNDNKFLSNMINRMWGGKDGKVHLAWNSNASPLYITEKYGDIEFMFAVAETHFAMTKEELMKSVKERL